MQEKWTKGVENCIEIVIRSPEIFLVDYQPGNCTRYSILFTFLGSQDVNKKAERYLCGHDIVITITNMNKSMTAKLGDYVHPSYVGEKLQMNSSDAEPIAALINHYLETKNEYSL